MRERKKMVVSVKVLGENNDLFYNLLLSKKKKLPYHQITKLMKCLILFDFFVSLLLICNN